ncbi:MAG: sialate O-acetylesterase [Planctomycetota bacterium]
MKRSLHSIAILMWLGFVASGNCAEPVQVFILVGQSNMQGHSHVSTFEAVGLDPDAQELHASMHDDSGEPVVCERVWISSIGNDKSEKEFKGKLAVGYGAAGRGPKIGPEFLFGITMQQAIEQPILIIKTAWGGKSLHTDFRPPSSGKYEFTDEQIERLKKRGKDVEEEKRLRSEASGHYYRLMLEHVRLVLSDVKRVCPDYDSEAGYELAGFVWFQGWNDMVDRGVYPQRDQSGGYANYSELLAQFIRDVRRDLDSPDLPFVIGVMGVGGPTDEYGAKRQRIKPVHQNFRDAMAAPAELPEFQESVAAVLTEKAWDAELAGLKDRGAMVNAKAKELPKTLTREQRQNKIEEIQASIYTPRELDLLSGSSNAEYHYLGSAKIMGRIGQAFAEAILELREKQ